MTALRLDRRQLRARLAFPRTLLNGSIEVDSWSARSRAAATVLFLLGPARLVLVLAASLPPRAGRHRAVRTIERLAGRVVARLLAVRLDVQGLEYIDRGER